GIGADDRLQRSDGAGRGNCSGRRVEIVQDRVDRALAHPGAADFDPAHAALRGERDEVRAQFGKIAAAETVFLLGEHDDGSSLLRLVRERCELRGIGSLTPRNGLNSVAWRLPSVMVPVLSSRSVSTSPAASTARPDIASTLKRTRRSMPAIPIADNSAPMVVGMSVTNSATRITTEIMPPA